MSPATIGRTGRQTSWPRSEQALTEAPLTEARVTEAWVTEAWVTEACEDKVCEVKIAIVIARSSTEWNRSSPG